MQIYGHVKIIKILLSHAMKKNKIKVWQIAWNKFTEVNFTTSLKYFPLSSTALDMQFLSFSTFSPRLKYQKDREKLVK